MSIVKQLRMMAEMATAPADKQKLEHAINLIRSQQRKIEAYKEVLQENFNKDFRSLLSAMVSNPQIDFMADMSPLIDIALELTIAMTEARLKLVKDIENEPEEKKGDACSASSSD